MENHHLNELKVELLEILGVIMAGQGELQAAIDTLSAKVDTLATDVATKLEDANVDLQPQIDALGAVSDKVDAIEATVA